MVEAIVDDQPRAVTMLASHAAVADVHVFGERIHVRLEPSVAEDGAALMRAALAGAGFSVTSTRVVPASLEDVFIAQLSGVRSRGMRDLDCVPLRALLLAATCARRGAQRRRRRPARVTLDEALARAAANSHRLGELRARESAAGAVLDQQRAADLPIVSAQAGYQRTNHVDEFRVLQLGRVQVLYPDVPDNWRARLDMQWPIYTGGRTKALEQAAAAEHSATGKDLESARADLRLETTRAFWALVTATESVSVVERVGQAHRGAAGRRARAIRRRVPAAQRRPHRGRRGSRSSARC